MKNRLLLVVAAISVAGLLAGGFFVYRLKFGTGFDERLISALSELQSLHTYEMLDETHATLPGRAIDIVGLYGLDFDAHRYSAVSTTTLTLLDEPGPRNQHTFTLQHRAIGDDVYVQIGTESPLLQKSIPYGPEWKHFPKSAIPDRFIDIAVPGPILDNLSLLGKNGTYLSLIGTPTDLSSGSTTYRVYTFTLSKKTTEVTTGPLKSLIDMIATGTVDVWVDDTPRVRVLLIKGVDYTATSTILSVNTPVDIPAPPASE